MSFLGSRCYVSRILSDWRNRLAFTQSPHWYDMWQKVKFSVGNPSVFTRANGQSLASPHTRGIGHIYCLFFSDGSPLVVRSTSRHLLEDGGLENCEPVSRLSDSDKLVFTPHSLIWDVAQGRDYCGKLATKITIDKNYPALTIVVSGTFIVCFFFLNRVTARRQSPDWVFPLPEDRSWARNRADTDETVFTGLPSVK